MSVYLTKRQFLTYYCTGTREVRVFPKFQGKPQIKANVSGEAAWLPVVFVVPDGGGEYDEQSIPLLPDIAPKSIRT